MKEKSIQMAKRIITYCAGLFVMAMGVSFSGTADLGMSPVNSIPYVLSEIFTALSMGTWIIIIFSLYIIIPVCDSGKEFPALADSPADLYHPLWVFHGFYQPAGGTVSPES